MFPQEIKGVNYHIDGSKSLNLGWSHLAQVKITYRGLTRFNFIIICEFVVKIPKIYSKKALKQQRSCVSHQKSGFKQDKHSILSCQ